MSGKRIDIHISTQLKSYWIDSLFVPAVGDTLELEDLTLVVKGRAWDVDSVDARCIRDVRLDCEAVS